jgi:hypothetical protein
LQVWRLAVGYAKVEGEPSKDRIELIDSRSRFNRDNVLNLAKYDPARPFFFCRGEDPAWVTRFHQ